MTKNHSWDTIAEETAFISFSVALIYVLPSTFMRATTWIMAFTFYSCATSEIFLPPAFSPDAKLPTCADWWIVLGRERGEDPEHNFLLLYYQFPHPAVRELGSFLYDICLRNKVPNNTNQYFPTAEDERNSAFFLLAQGGEVNKHLNICRHPLWKPHFLSFALRPHFTRYGVI